MQNVSKFQAITQCKCPKCRKGNVFQHPWARLNKFNVMNKHCPECGVRYEVEPGFFFGAMYISYAFSVATFIICGLGTYFLGKNPEAWVYVTVVIVAVLLTFPSSFRYSRVLMLHLFSGIKYRPGVLDESTAGSD